MTASQIDQLIADALGVPVSGLQWQNARPAVSNAHLRSTEEEYTISYVIPGIKREEVSVSTENNVLTVSVDAPTAPHFAKDYAKFTRTYNLSADAGLDSINATHADGVLTVTIPRVKPKKKIRTVSIN
jgi:HSP20 family protein